MGYNVGSIANSYSSGSVTGSTNATDIGGLVGYNTGTIATSYATGSVTGATNATSLGGLTGYNSGTGVSASYWDITTTRQTLASGTGTASGTTGLTDVQSKLAASYGGWDFTNVWVLGSNGYPKLMALRPTLTITANNASMVYGSSSLPTLSFSYSGFASGDSSFSLTAKPTTATTATAGSSAGTYGITIGGAIDPDYIIVYVPGTFTVTPKALSWSIAGGTSVYGTTATPVVTLTGILSGDTVAATAGLISGSLVLNPKAGTPAGTYSETVAGLTGASAGNYTWATTGSGGIWTVTPASLIVTAASASRAFGAGNAALSVGYAGFVAGDTVASLTSAANLRTTATANASPGNYAIVAYGAVDPNYAITYVPGILSVLNPLTGQARMNALPAAAGFSAGPMLAALSANIPWSDGASANGEPSHGN